jgi:hypothetical protein
MAKRWTTANVLPTNFSQTGRGRGEMLGKEDIGIPIGEKVSLLGTTSV